MISKRRDVCGIIDNSNEVVALFPDDYKGLVFHFGVSTSPIRRDYEIIPCPEWSDVEREIGQQLARLRNLSP